MNTDALLSLVVAFLMTWQVKTLAGLIAIDIVLGIAAALRSGVFDFRNLAKFYSSMVIPYVLGYLVFFVVVNFVIPVDSLGEFGGTVNEATVTLAWVALVGSLAGSIKDNFTLLYQPQTATK